MVYKPNKKALEGTHKGICVSCGRFKDLSPNRVCYNCWMTKPGGGF